MALLPIAPAHALRCGRQLVQVGDHKLDVLDRCGDPDSVSERRAVRGGRFRHSTGVVQLERFDEITIEEWIYNFGPRRFKQQLYFEDGILTQIRDLGYGH
ncbi:MAG: DUF2845 domain-containing protein [Methylomonas sp.]|nr:DUF2845 domain-containing protein [Methylomonas sp.]PPD19647.1 MAG: hypothetical protein CTY23_11310 [Methylomonas sp.]PPD24199.1 MAG: hypothetical protein CTY22_11400 [Methylomonas sp.]PPD32770.1 MAG: hypothetical protein CTY21_11325 [Methylomonas sp.]PPD41198.1 MAG: hypothetical protein CTY17_04330 [Methylomonas sp.]